VLLVADGLTSPQIAERPSCNEPTVVKWRSHRFREEGQPVGRGEAAVLARDIPAGDVRFRLKIGVVAR
jgi:hypothetical protein